MSITYAFLKTGAIDLLVARLPGGAGIIPPRDYVPPEELIVEPTEIIPYPQTVSNDIDSRWSTWIYELDDDEYYTMTIRSLPLWIVDGVLTVTDEVPWTGDFTSGVTVSPQDLYSTVNTRLAGVGAPTTYDALGFSYVAVGAFETVLTHRFLVFETPRNFWAKAGAYQGSWTDSQETPLLPGETTTTTTSTTTTTQFPVTTTTTRKVAAPTARVASIPFAFTEGDLSEADFSFGFNNGGAKNLPVPLPDEYAEEFSDFDNVQIRNYNFWHYGEILFRNYTGIPHTTFDAEGNISALGSLNIGNDVIAGNKITAGTDVEAQKLTAELLSDGVTEVRIEDLIQLFERVTALETPP
jgi:hypothetical protein